MVMLVGYLLVVLALWWIWERDDRGRRAEGTGAASRPLGTARAAPPRTPARRPVRRRQLDDPALTEDDVIAFGLALERSLDVAGAARADPGRPAEPRVRRDVGGPP